jgi:TonB family protein
MSSAANPSSRFAQFGVGLSVAVHVGAFVVLTLVPKLPAPAPLASVVEFELSKPPEPPPPAPKADVPAPEPPALEPASIREERAPAEAAPVADTPEPEPAPEQAPVADLTGLTLTNDNGSGSWASQVGNGAASDRPIRAGTNRPRSPAPAVSALASPEPGRTSNIVALGDLSSRPVPPKLDGILEQHYPDVARQQGKSGTAIVRLRIDADGRVRKVNIVSESETGFGRACHATVMGSQWSAPRDQEGKAVATFVSYTCRFRSNP